MPAKAGILIPYEVSKRWVERLFFSSKEVLTALSAATETHLLQKLL